MRRFHNYKNMKLHAGGFTLIELAVVVTIIALMMSAFISVSFVLKGRSDKQKTKAIIAVIETAIDQYHVEKDHYPTHLIDCRDVASADSSQLNFYQNTDTQLDAVRYNTAYLLWQLGKVSSLRQMIDKISSDNISDVGLDQSFGNLPSSCVTPVDRTQYRYVLDAYGAPMNYQASGGLGGAPVVISAGPDGLFDTEDDIRSGRN